MFFWGFGLVQSGILDELDLQDSQGKLMFPVVLARMAPNPENSCWESDEDHEEVATN